jgi:hypothetical protein
VVTIQRQQGRLFATQYLRSQPDLSLADAKAIVMHLTSAPNTCHRCANQQLSLGESVCAKCNSVNLNW